MRCIVGVDMTLKKISGSTEFGFIADKVGFLQTCIEEVEHAMEERQNAHDAFLAEIDQQDCDVKNRIYALQDASPNNPNRIALDQILESLQKEKRQEIVGCWRDCVELQKELRALRKEHRSIAGVLWFIQKK